MLCPLARKFLLCLVLVQPKGTNTVTDIQVIHVRQNVFCLARAFLLAPKKFVFDLEMCITI